MAKYFITGGTGFLGRQLLQRLGSGKDEVICLCRKRRQLPPAKDPIKWIEGDILDASTYVDELHEAEFVIHLAGLLSSRRKEDYGRINVEGTKTLLGACRRAGRSLKRFVHMSSVAAMGPKHHPGRLSEGDACHPWSEYGRSKHQAERVAQAFSEYLPIVVLRPAFVYGPGDPRGVKFLQSLNSDSWVTWASRIKSICLSHVGDVANSSLLALKKGIESGETFIIADPGVSTFEDVLMTLGDILNDLLKQGPRTGIRNAAESAGWTSRFGSMPSSARRCQFWACDTSKARTKLGFYPEVPFSRGVHDTISWYLDQGMISRQDLMRIRAGAKGGEIG